MTKNLFFALLLAWGGGSAALADNQPEWLNPQVNQQNREARRANFFAYETEALAKAGDKAGLGTLSVAGGHVAVPLCEEPSGRPC